MILESYILTFYLSRTGEYILGSKDNFQNSSDEGEGQEDCHADCI